MSSFYKPCFWAEGLIIQQLSHFAQTETCHFFCMDVLSLKNGSSGGQPRHFILDRDLGSFNLQPDIPPVLPVGFNDFADTFSALKPFVLVSG